MYYFFPCLLSFLILFGYGKKPFTPYFNNPVNIQKLFSNQPSVYAIPKIIHQVWVGKNKIHPECLKAMQTWQKKHPTWTYRLWTDDDIDDFEWTNKDLFLALKNPGAKADVWRYEILNMYGGLYVDVDFVCLKSFEEFHDKLTFYSGFIGELSEYTVANGLFACCPNHPILLNIIENLSNLERPKKPLTEDEIMNNMGPYFFTKCIREYKNDWMKLRSIKNHLYIFKPSVFYPIKPIHWTIMAKNNLQIPKELSKLTKNSYAVHLYARSWCDIDQSSETSGNQ